MLKKITLSVVLIMGLTSFSFADADNEIINFNNDKLELNDQVINQKPIVKFYPLTKTKFKYKIRQSRNYRNNIILPYFNIGKYSKNYTDKDKFFTYGLFFSHRFNYGLNSLNIDIRTTNLKYKNGYKSSINEGTIILDGTNPSKKLFGKFGIHYINASKIDISKGLILISGVNKYQYYMNAFGSSGMDLYVRRLDDLNTTIVQITPNITYINYLPFSRSLKFNTAIDLAKSTKAIGPSKKTIHYGIHLNTTYNTSKYSLNVGGFIGKETALVDNGGYIAHSSTEERKYGVNSKFTYYINKRFNISYKFTWDKYKSTTGNPTLTTNTLFLMYKF